MQNKPNWFTGLGLGLLALFACGGETEVSTQEVADNPMQVHAGDPARILLVFAVHGLQRGEVDAAIAPNLARLRQEGTHFPGHVIQSTGGQSEMCTLLTGRSPLQHGVGSIHESGLSALPASEVTLAEFLAERGFATLASMALPQFDPEISGLKQGFDTYLVPDVLGDTLRRSDRVEMVLREDLKSALAQDKPVFAWIQIADALRPGLEPTPNVLKYVKAQLRAMLPQNPGLQPSVEIVDRGPDEFEEVRRAILRSRGSTVYKAFMQGVYDGQLADLDAVVAQCLEAIQGSGRNQEALVALVSTQGAGPDPRVEVGGPNFPSEVVRSPFWLWSPGRVSAGADPRLLSSRHVPDLLCDLLGLQFGDQNQGEAVVELWDAGMTRRAVVGTRLHLEENAAAGWLGFDDSDTTVVMSEAWGAELRAQWNALQAAAAMEPVRFGYELAFDRPDPVTVRWSLVEGRSRRAFLDPPEAGELGRVTPLSGSAVLKGKGILRLETFAREAPVVWSVEGIPPASESANQPVLHVIRDPYGPKIPAGEAKGKAQVYRDSGIWTRVMVPGAEPLPLKIFAGLVPKKQNSTSRAIQIEWTVGFNDQVERLAGRDDAILLQGKTPLNVQFKEVPGHTLCLAVQVQDRWLSADELSFEDSWLVPAGVRTVFTPEWWPGVTDALLEETGMPLAPGLGLRRFGPLPKARKALSPDASFLVSRLGRGE